MAWISLSGLRPWTPTAQQLNLAFEREVERVKEQQAEQDAAIQARTAAMTRAGA
ncbi:hypothetical protein BH20ACT24_BH20ACT24_16240 [soil metagenome]